MNRRILIVCVVVAVAAAAGYWFVLRDRDPVVATVNGEDILRSELSLRVETEIAQYQAYGIEVSGDMLAEMRDGALDQLIVEALLSQSAAAAGIVVEETDVDAFYQEWVSDFESEDEFLAMLRENDYAVERLRADIRRHLLISRYEEQYIEENVDPASLKVTEAEKRELYDSYAEQVEDIPPYEEIAEYLELELRDQRIYELGIIETLVEDLRGAAEIEILL